MALTFQFVAQLNGLLKVFEAGYAGPLANVVQVTTEEGVSGVYT